MNGKLLILLTILLPTLVLLCFATNQMELIQQDNEINNLRELLGFSSVAIGNLSPASRQPGLEMFCTSMSDVPGGYCNYFSNGFTRDFSDYIAKIIEGTSK